MIPLEPEGSTHGKSTGNLLTSEVTLELGTRRVEQGEEKSGNKPPVTIVVEGAETKIAPATAEQKAQRRLELKARSTLFMDIPNEHQLKFNSIKDAKSLLQTIEKRFEGNAASKKTQRNLLKQQYENFTASSSEVNKPEIDTLSLDDLYNNLKVYEPEVKRVSNSSTNTQNMAFVSSSSNNNINSSNEAVNIAFEVTTAGTQLNLNGSEIVAFDKTKVECYNCHKRGHFARECRAPRAQDNRNRKSTRRNVPVETTNSSALVSCDGLRSYDWSDQAEKGPNYALTAYSTSSSDFEISTDSNCLKTCLKIVETLKSQNEQLLKGLRISKIQTITYKTELRMKLELAQKQKDEIQLTVENFENSSKSLSKLLDSQIADKCKAGLRYNVIPPPYTENFLPLKLDLSSLEEIVNEPIVSETNVKKTVVETSEVKASEDKPQVVKNNFGPLFIEDWISDSEDEAESRPKIDKKTVKPSFAKTEFVKSKEQVKSLRKTAVKQHNQLRQHTNHPRGNQINWNNMMSQRL
nr:ribonuclease H-like domain-containing protein [Tanacetum cinerariifolium]